MKLFIDSATYYLYLAIVDEKNNKKYSFSRLGKNDHSETLTTFLEQFLNDNNLKVEDITEVYVGRGPGSYTGLRIAGTVGKVFAFIKKLPFYSFSSLDLIACKVIDQVGKYLVKIKAKKGYSYIKAYTVSDKVTIDVDDSFVEDTALSNYIDYSTIEIDDNFFNDGGELASNILKYGLFKKEDFYTYVPNYLRSELS
ncbi:MAG: tRNA (adenosine(37)-N6)-threonylcarbamoyltransferase complex dimerization subunit type 1 TsaB [Bacilli bacterium]